MRFLLKEAFGWHTILLLGILSSTSFASAMQTQRVVVLYDERLDFPGLASLDASLVRTLTASASPPEIYREALDLSRFGSPEYASVMRDYLERKYRGQKIDVAIAVMGPSIDFLLSNGAQAFPGAAIIFCGIDRHELRSRKLPSDVTGVLLKREFRPTLDLALRLHPDTRRVVVLAGTSPFEGRVLKQLREELSVFESRLDMDYLVGLPMDKMLSAVSSLPPHTIVLYTALFRDGAGRSFVPHDALRQIERASNAPIYAFVDQFLGLGIVGGYLYSVDAHGELVGKMAQRVLAGDRPESVPMVEASNAVAELDWRQVKKWDINPSLIPGNVAIRFRQPSVWDRYYAYIIAALALTILQGSIIIALALERRRRLQSQRRHALASASGRVGVWDWNLETDEMYVDPFLESVLGYSAGDDHRPMGDWRRHIFPADAHLVATLAREAIEGRHPSYEVEHRMLHHDGSIRWFLSRGSVIYRNGKPSHMTGTETDITDRKNAQEALEEVRTELTRVSRLSALGEFAASVAHEVRQPLSAITLNVQACLRWMNDATPNLRDIRAALSDVIIATRRADQVIQRNRELFKIHLVRLEPLDINSVIHEVEALAAPRLKKTHTKLTTAFTFDLPLAMGDRVEVGQVLLNLIANSIDATQTLPADRRHILITTTHADGGGVQVSVADNGVGLEGVDLERLFTLSYTTKPDGTGVGLSLCRSIIEAHGGRVWAAANPGSGATFSFVIPGATTEIRLEA